MDANWRIERVWKNADNIIQVVQYRVDFTSDEYPGAVSTHAGTIPLSELEISADAPTASIVEGIKTAFADQLDYIEDLHLNQLRFEFLMNDNEVVDIDPVEDGGLPPLTNRQVRMGLRGAGISLDDVDAALDAIENEEQRDYAKIEWEYATQFERDHPLIEQVGASLGLAPEQIDQMWTAALDL